MKLAERVRKFAAEEKEIHLFSPPFHTIADEVASASVVVVNEFWKRYGALDEIIPVRWFGKSRYNTPSKISLPSLDCLKRSTVAPGSVQRPASHCAGCINCKASRQDSGPAFVKQPKGRKSFLA